MAKVKIGSSLNGVTVNYASGADNEVDQALVTLLKAVVKPKLAEDASFSSLYVSATTNGTHSTHSRHSSGKAIDISRINGKRMKTHYDSDADVQAIVDAMQTEADKQSGIRENFGPHFKHKHGKNWTVSGHKDHIHFSID